MDYFTILKMFSIKISSAAFVGLLLLLYMRNKLETKADKSELNELKKELAEILKEKLDATHNILEMSIDKVKSVFDVQNEKMQEIIDIHVKAINKNIKKIEEKRE